MTRYTKTWGQIYNANLARGHDHGSAAFVADQYERQARKAGVVIPTRAVDRPNERREKTS